MTDKNREAFETTKLMCTERLPSGSYTNPHVRQLFEGWQLRDSTIPWGALEQIAMFFDGKIHGETAEIKQLRAFMETRNDK